MSSVTFTQEEHYVVVFETGDRTGIPALLFYVADFLKKQPHVEAQKIVTSDDPQGYGSDNTVVAGAFRVRLVLRVLTDISDDVPKGGEA